jgi:hypothetical protein
MNRFESPAFSSVAGARGRAVVLHLSLVLVASGLTAAIWLGAATESGRHRAAANPAATHMRVRITLPTVVVVGHREGQQEARTRIAAATPQDRGPASDPPAAQRTMR